MRTLWAVAGLICMGLVGQAAVAQDEDQSATGEVLKGEYSTGRAMDLLYGDFDAGTKSSVWAARHGSAHGSRWPGTVRVRILTDATYTDDGVPRHVLVTWAKPEEGGAGEYSCHACGVLVGVGVFRKDGGGWKVESSNLKLAELGAWGKPPSIKAQRLGAHTWGLAADVGDMHQGELEHALWIYGPNAGGFSEWFKAELVDDDKYGEFPQDDWCKVRAGELDVMCVWREIDYAVQPGAGKEMYDLVRTRRKPNGVKREVWRFAGNRFVAAK